MNDFSKYLTVMEVAKMLNVTPDWVRDLIQSKKLKAVKMVGWRIDPKELKRFLQSRSNI